MTQTYQIKDVSKFQDGSIRSIELSGGPAHVNGGTVYAVPYAQWSDLVRDTNELLMLIRVGATETKQFALAYDRVAKATGYEPPLTR